MIQTEAATQGTYTGTVHSDSTQEPGRSHTQ